MNTLLSVLEVSGTSESQRSMTHVVWLVTRNVLSCSMGFRHSLLYVLLVSRQSWSCSRYSSSINTGVQRPWTPQSKFFCVSPHSCISLPPTQGLLIKSQPLLEDLEGGTKSTAIGSSIQGLVREGYNLLKA